MKNYENIYNCLRVIQQNKKQEVEICQLLAADLLKAFRDFLSKMLIF